MPPFLDDSLTNSFIQSPSIIHSFILSVKMYLLTTSYVICLTNL